MAALPGPTGLIDRFTGNRIQGFADRMTGATMARNQQDTNAYMRDLMRNDPGYDQYSFSNRMRRLFGRSDSGGGGQPPSQDGRMQSGPMAPTFNPYQAPTASAGSPQWGTGGPSPRLQFQQYVPAPIGSGQTNLYGSGQGMMRAPEAPRGPSMLPSANSGSLGNRPMMGVISGAGVYNFMDNAARSAIIWPEYIE